MTQAEYKKKIEELRVRTAQIRKDIDNLNLEAERGLSQKDKEEVKALKAKAVENAKKDGEMVLKNLFPDYLMGDQGF